jgi:hypothetical protein
MPTDHCPGQIHPRRGPTHRIAPALKPHIREIGLPHSFLFAFDRPYQAFNQRLFACPMSFLVPSESFTKQFSGVDTESIGNSHEFDDIDSTFARLYLPDERMRQFQPSCQIPLRKTGTFTRFRECRAQ